MAGCLQTGDVQVKVPDARFRGDGNVQAVIFVQVGKQRLEVEREVRKQIRELIELWLKQVGSGIDLQTAATAASWTIYGLALQWSQNKRAVSSAADRFAEQILPLVTVYFKAQAATGGRWG